MALEKGQSSQVENVSGPGGPGGPRLGPPPMAEAETGIWVLGGKTSVLQWAGAGSRSHGDSLSCL